MAPERRLRVEIIAHPFWSLIPAPRAEHVVEVVAAASSLLGLPLLVWNNHFLSQQNSDKVLGVAMHSAWSFC